MVLMLRSAQVSVLSMAGNEGVRTVFGSLSTWGILPPKTQDSMSISNFATSQFP